MAHSTDNSSKDLPSSNGTTKSDTAPIPPARPVQPPADPLPNPEPAAPSLDQPDPGVFHHNPVKFMRRPQHANATKAPHIASQGDDSKGHLG